MKRLLLMTLAAACSLHVVAAQNPKWSWLDKTTAPRQSANPAADKLLKPYAATLRPAIYSFDAERQLTGQTPLGTTTTVGNNVWKCDISATEASKGVMDITMRVTLQSGSAPRTAVALAIDLKDWSSSNYVLVPAAAYDGNRFPVLDVGYPGFFRDKGNAPGERPRITNIAHLGINDGSAPTVASKMENAATDATTPMIAFFDRERGRSLMLMTDVETSLGTSGLIVEEDPATRHATLVVSAPVIREYRTMHATQIVSDDTAPDWTAGSSVTMNFKLFTAKAHNLQGFFTQFLDNRKLMTGPNEFRNLTPFSKAFDLQHTYQNSSDRWFDKGGYYKNGNGDSPNGHIQIGWVGGLMQTYPLLMCGDERSRERIASTFNVVCDNMQGRSGLFYGVYKDGQTFGDGFDNTSEKRALSMMRKNADALYFMIKQLQLIKESDIPFAKADVAKWEAATRRLADAFVAVWERYGELGQVVDVESGEMYAYGSSAPAMAPAALALASRYFAEPKYMDLATKAARLYYTRDVMNGYTTGGPGEILQCPDSESAYAMLESFVVLYELTQDNEWLRCAEAMAPICASWVMSYDYDFPANSELGRIQARSTGSVWASIQNRHSAPGICSASGDFLLKLYRATGNERYLELLRDISHNILEFMTTPTHRVSCPNDGFVNERVNVSEWEGKGNVGAVICSSVSWCELAVMLTTVEIPGIYVVPDRGLMYTFDHVYATMIESDKNGATIKVSNPTPYDARVSVLCESSAATKAPLGCNIYPRLPKIELAAGATAQYRLSADGTIAQVK